MYYEHVIRAVANQPWMIQREKADQMIALLSLRAAGERVAPEIVSELREAAESRRVTASGGAVAVIPIVGVISQRAPLIDAMSGPGGTSTVRVQQALRAALADPNVSAIVLDIDSPGGSVYGVDELAAEIYEASGRKPVYSIANSLEASAAYYLGSQAIEAWATPGGEVGSIGVYAVHDDMSRALDAAGITPTYVIAGKYKAELSPDFPLSDAAREYLQGRVDQYYTMFVNAVARGRGVKAADVRRGFGEGRVVGARDALRLGMIDRVGTIEELINRAASGRTARRPGARAAESVTVLVEGRSVKEEAVEVIEEAISEASEQGAPAWDGGQRDRDLLALDLDLLTAR
jgi:signal peptide peptidase SppA